MCKHGVCACQSKAYREKIDAGFFDFCVLQFAYPILCILKIQVLKFLQFPIFTLPKKKQVLDSLASSSQKIQARRWHLDLPSG